MTTKQDLHRLIDALPDAHIEAVNRYLAELCDATRAGPPTDAHTRQLDAAGWEQATQHTDISLRRE